MLRSTARTPENERLLVNERRDRSAADGRVLQGWRLLTSPWAVALWMTLIGVGATLAYRPDLQPITGDRAFFVYSGQVVYRGDPLYTTSVYGYPPLGPLLAAAAMAFGAPLGLPTYLAPRYFAVGLTALAVALAYLVTRRATGSGRTGVVAGLLLAGIGPLSRYSAVNLEPKLLLMLFSVGAAYALQHRSWLIAGIIAALAISCWQPGGLVGLVALCVLLRGADRRGPALLRYSAGVMVGLAPALIYLVASGGLAPFFLEMLHLSANRPEWTPTYWLRVLWGGLSGERVFVVLAAAGFLWYCVDTFRQSWRSWGLQWLEPRWGGLPILTLGWAAFNTIDFQGDPDLMPFLPCVAFWAAWALYRCFLSEAAPLRLPPTLYRALTLGALPAIAVYAFVDALAYRPSITLAQQQELLRGVVPAFFPRGSVFAINAEEIYVLSEQPAPWPFLRLGSAFTDVALRNEPDPCQAIVRQLEAAAPELIILGRVDPDTGYDSSCLPAVERDILPSYTVSPIHRPEQQRTGRARRADRDGQVLWYVYRKGA